MFGPRRIKIKTFIQIVQIKLLGQFFDFGAGLERRKVVEGRKKIQILAAGQAPIKTSLFANDQADQRFYFFGFTAEIAAENPGAAFIVRKKGA